MIISHIVLKNWRNFRSAEVDLRERVFLVGPNACGKSNFLDALRFLRDLAKPGAGTILAPLASSARERGDDRQAILLQPIAPKPTTAPVISSKFLSLRRSHWETTILSTDEATSSSTATKLISTLPSTHQRDVSADSHRAFRRSHA